MEYDEKIIFDKLSKITNILTCAGVLAMIIMLLIYLILYPSESEPAADLTPKSEYEFQQSIRSEFIIKEESGNSPGLKNTKLNEIESKYKRSLDDITEEINENDKVETSEDIIAWNNVFSQTLDYIFEHCTGELIQTEALYLKHLEPDFEPGQLILNSLKSENLSPGSKPKICYYISYRSLTDIPKSELQLLGMYLRKIWTDNGYDYNSEILISIFGNPNQIIDIYDNGELIY